MPGVHGLYFLGPFPGLILALVKVGVTFIRILGISPITRCSVAGGWILRYSSKLCRAQIRTYHKRQ